MAFSLSSILPPILTLVSIYTAQKSYVAITNLQRYEEKSEKAAKHLDKAAHELWKTRVTQASGAGAVSEIVLYQLHLFCLGRGLVVLHLIRDGLWFPLHNDPLRVAVPFMCTPAIMIQAFCYS